MVPLWCKLTIFESYMNYSCKLCLHPKFGMSNCFQMLLVYVNRVFYVSQGGTSATQRQKFQTNDTKSVRNSVRSANWSTEQFHCSGYCLRMTDKRQKVAKVKCKCNESLTKQSIFVEYSLLQKKHLSFARADLQMNTTLFQN